MTVAIQAVTEQNVEVLGGLVTNKMDLVVKKSAELQKFSENINSITKTIRRNETQRKNKFIIFSIIIVGILIALILIIT